MNEKSIEIARDRYLLAKDILQYDAVPFPMLFDEEGFMTKPVNSEIICVLGQKLEFGDYSSPAWVSLPATVCRYTLLVCSAYQIHRMTDIYHTYGCCDYIFDIYDDTP